ncbi:phosphoribosyltransferase [Streptomyces sp. NPDC057616]|uniref:phosphoribosyltransferase n=1 Tax=Streptomyces sp. NPDC057616 TaxID=3346183 RepID=UPI00368EAC33
MQFHDREQAGRELAARLRIEQEKGMLCDPVVLALPRGGVTVAQEVASALEAPLDVLVVRKIGVPYEEELGVGAIVGDDEPLYDEQSLRELGLGDAELAPVVEREREELHRREDLYREGRPAPELKGRTVIVVDDGLATGSTARAALRFVRRREPARLVLAVPVGSPDAADRLRPEADEVLCLQRPPAFLAVGNCYEEFDQLTDDDVLRTLHATAGP